jgi:hypothetical protein
VLGLQKSFRKEFTRHCVTSTYLYVQSCILIYKDYTHGALSSCFVNEASHFYMATHSSHAEYENHPHMVLPSSSLHIDSCLYRRTIIICTKQSAALEIMVRTETPTLGYLNLWSWVSEHKSQTRCSWKAPSCITACCISSAAPRFKRTAQFTQSFLIPYSYHCASHHCTCRPQRKTQNEAASPCLSQFRSIFCSQYRNSV